jgi:hypothetical protein
MAKKKVNKKKEETQITIDLEKDLGNLEIENKKGLINLKKKVDDNKISVTVYDVDVSGYKFLGNFLVERWVDTESKAVYLRNIKNKFMIPFPEIKDSNSNSSIGKITNRILQLEQSYEAEMQEDTEAINEFDLLEELDALKKKLRGLLYNSNSIWGYKDGMSHLILARKGENFFPAAFDKDTSTLNIISNTRDTLSRTLKSNKLIKYGPLTNIGVFSLLLIISIFVLFGSGAYMWYKQFELQTEVMDSSAYVSLLKECKEGIHINNEEMKKSIIIGMSESLINYEEQKRENLPKGSGG